MRTVPCDTSSVDEVAKVLLAGGVAVIPTDTVYGLAAHPDFPDAVERLYEIKGRSRQKPIALLASSVESVVNAGFGLSSRAFGLAEKFWPGALTLVLHGISRTEGFRVPAHEWTRALIAKCGGLLRVTSANLSGGQAAVEAGEALNAIGLSFDILVDGGVSSGGVASTVVLVDCDGSLKVLRHGAVEVGDV